MEDNDNDRYVLRIEIPIIPDSDRFWECVRQLEKLIEIANEELEVFGVGHMDHSNEFDDPLYFPYDRDDEFEQKPDQPFLSELERAILSRHYTGK